MVVWCGVVVMVNGLRNYEPTDQATLLDEIRHRFIRSAISGRRTKAAAATAAAAAARVVVEADGGAASGVIARQ